MTTTIKLWSLMTAAVMALCLTACNEKSDNEELKPDKPTPQVPTGNKFTIAPTGGTVETGTFKMEIPAGTFTGEADVYVDEVGAGSVRGEDEVSKFYKLTLPVTTKKPMKVTIQCSTSADDVFLVAHAPVVGLSNWEEGYGDVPIEATYNNGAYTAEIPAFENGDSNETSSFTVGLARVVRDDGTASTRAGEKHRVGNIAWHINKTHRFNIANATGDLEAALHQYIRESITILQGLGFKVEGKRDIPFEFALLKTGEYGQFCQSAVCDAWSTVKLSEKLVTESSLDNIELKQTIIHELMHYFQSDYDPRWPATKWRFVKGDELMMYECGGVWAEKFMNDGKPSAAFIRTWIYCFMRGLNGYLEEIYGMGEGERHQAHGYSMAALLEYFSQEFGNDKMVGLYELWKKNKQDTFYNLANFATENHSMLFTYDYYDDFTLALCQDQVIDGINVGALTDKNAQTKLTNDLTATATSTNYTYGCSVWRATMENQYPNPEQLKNKELVVTQATEGLQTYVLLLFNKKYELLGKAIPGTPFVVGGNVLDRVKPVPGGNGGLFYLITTNQKNKEKLESQLTISLSDPLPQLSLSKTELSFTAEGGEKQIEVTTNCTDVRVTQKPDWCSASISGNILTLKAEKNTTTEKRDGSLIIMAGNSVGDVPAEVKVTQEGKKSGLTCLYDRCLVSFDIPLGETSSCSFACPTPPQNGTSVVNLNTIVYTSSGSIGDDDKRETWDYNFIIDYETNTITEGRVHYHQVFNMWWGWTYDDPPRHKLATRIVYDVSFNVINLPLYRPNARWDSSNYLDLEDVWMHGYGGSNYYGSGELNQYITNFSYSCITEDHMGSSGTKTSTWGTDDIDLTRYWILNIMLEPILPQ